MRDYETVYVLRPELPEGEVKGFSDKLTALIERYKGNLAKSTDMGKKTLGYRIKKETKGRYICLNYKGDGALINELERTLKLDGNVIRYLTVKVD